MKRWLESTQHALVLLGAASLVLLITCANATNLLFRAEPLAGRDCVTCALALATAIGKTTVEETTLIALVAHDRRTARTNWLGVFPDVGSGAHPALERGASGRGRVVAYRWA